MWLNLKLNHKDLFDKSLELEKRALYTKDGIRKRKMEPLVKLKGKEGLFGSEEVAPGDTADGVSVAATKAPTPGVAQMSSQKQRKKEGRRPR